MVARHEIISSDIVADYEHVEVVLGLRCPLCPDARSIIPHDARLVDGTSELMCPCGRITLISLRPIEWETVEDEEEAP